MDSGYQGELLKEYSIQKNWKNIHIIKALILKDIGLVIQRPNSCIAKETEIDIKFIYHSAQLLFLTLCGQDSFLPIISDYFLQTIFHFWVKIKNSIDVQPQAVSNKVW